MASLLNNIWYFGIHSDALKAGTLLHRQICNEPVVFGRTVSGRPFALRDICPHRGIPLSNGIMKGEELECWYHGWRFSTDGICKAIPALVSEDPVDLSKITVQTYQIHEEQGLIWLWLGDKENIKIPAPRIPIVGNIHPKIVHELEFPVNIDHAVVGLIDPAHTPHVHESWFWRRPHERTDKTKHFEPSNLGFDMVSHRASSNSKVYHLLGGTPDVKISFWLPGLRIEHIQTGKNYYCGLTVCTPISPNSTMTTHIMWWSMRWANIFKPVIKHFSKTFLGQDQKAFIRQSKGLSWNPALRLTGQPDQQAKWYFRIKNEWIRSSESGRPFKNPLKKTTLRWRT